LNPFSNAKKGSCAMIQSWSRRTTTRHQIQSTSSRFIDLNESVRHPLQKQSPRLSDSIEDFASAPKPDRPKLSQNGLHIQPVINGRLPSGWRQNVDLMASL